MLDLETMGSGPDAAITAIGAVAFDKNGTGSKFYTHVDLTSSVNLGLVMDPSTVIWWMGQNEHARQLFKEKGADIVSALQLFEEWARVVETADKVRVWGNGANFDNVVLASAIRKARLNQPWKFWNDRCYRTMKAQYPKVKIQRKGTHHNALDDAITQAEHLIAILREGSLDLS